MLFKHNKANTGGGVFGSGLAVVFKTKSNVTFYKNSTIADDLLLTIQECILQSVISSANSCAKSFASTLYSIERAYVNMARV